jgi:hypothetical protein
MQMNDLKPLNKKPVGRKQHPNKEQCRKILAEIIPFLPSKYTKIIQENLLKKGIEVSIRQINSTRSGNTFNLDILAEMRSIAELNKQKIQNTFK